MLINSIQKTLNDLQILISKLDKALYSKPCLGLSKATIGEHTRHIIELFQCLINHYDLGVVDYDQRKRDFAIQNDTLTAVDAIQTVANQLEKPNKEIKLIQKLNGEIISILSNYERELLYNLEHCVHHQALIKVALLEFNFSEINQDFGVANSTLEYRNQCAQ